MENPLARLLALFDLEQTGMDRFRGPGGPTTWKRIYGGQVIAQALASAQRTVGSERPAHSLHAYFLLAGDPTAPIDFEVERLHDGRSFSARRCAAKQRGHTILSLEASFQTVEEGFDHAVAPPSVEGPETLPTSSALAERFKSFLPCGPGEWPAHTHLLDMRLVDPEAFVGAKEGVTRQYIWFRFDAALPDDDALHRVLLAYLSDMSLLTTALAAHGRSIFDPAIQVASLDHAVWFHRPFRANEWMLYAQESTNAAGARGFSRGEVFTRDGKLIASVAQEGLMRERKPRS